MCSLHFCMDNASLITSDSVEILLETSATTFQCEYYYHTSRSKVLEFIHISECLPGATGNFVLEKTTLTARHREPLLFQDLAA